MARFCSPFGAAVGLVEVEAIGHAEGGRLGVDGVVAVERRVPVLVLEVCLCAPVVGELVVEAAADGVDGAGSLEVERVVIEDAAVLVGNLTAAEEEISVGMEAVVPILDLGAKQEVELAVDMAAVDGCGAAEFEG